MYALMCSAQKKCAKVQKKSNMRKLFLNKRKFICFLQSRGCKTMNNE